MSTLVDYRHAPEAESLKHLQEAYEGSFYTICGAGGELQKWIEGYNGLMADRGIGEPIEYRAVTGAEINEFASDGATLVIGEQDCFPEDLTCLLFPLDGLDCGKLALLKLERQDRWFDDVIDNMRRR